jgi:ubiquinone/menaquinone biosynthesis C-methylase UbiE
MDFAERNGTPMKRKSKGISLDYMAGQYDKVTFTERSLFRRKQVALIGLKEGESVLDVGCGTGSLSILAKLAVGDAGRVCGIDIAPRMILKAKEKAERYKLDIDFRPASITGLPFPDERFDVVTSSLVFHHLPVAVKKEGLKEIHRVMKRDGRFFLADFSAPHTITAPLILLLLIWLGSTRYQLFGKLPGLIREAGFREVRRLKKGLFLDYFIIRKG